MKSNPDVVFLVFSQQRLSPAGSVGAGVTVMDRKCSAVSWLQDPPSLSEQHHNNHNNNRKPSLSITGEILHPLPKSRSVSLIITIPDMACKC